MTARVTLYAQARLPPLRRRPRRSIERVCADLGEAYDEVDITTPTRADGARYGEEIPVTFVDGQPARLLAGRRGPAAARARRLTATRSPE